MPGFVFGPCGVLPPLPSWTPASVTTAFWYDASNFASITQSGGTVSQWNDLSGNARNLAQATIGNQPAYATGVLNGLPGLHFINTTSGATSSVMGTASFAQSQILTTVMAFKTTGIVYDTSGNMGSNGKILEGDPVGGAGGTRLVVFGAISSGHANYSAGVGVDVRIVRHHVRFGRTSHYRSR